MFIIHTWWSAIFLNVFCRCPTIYCNGGCDPRHLPSLESVENSLSFFPKVWDWTSEAFLKAAVAATSCLKPKAWQAVYYDFCNVSRGSVARLVPPLVSLTLPAPAGYSLQMQIWKQRIIQKIVEINSDAAWEYLLSLSIAWRRLMQLTRWEGRFLLGLLPCTVAWNKETRRCYFEEGTWRIRNPQHHTNQSASWQTTTNIHQFHRDSKPLSAGLTIYMTFALNAWRCPWPWQNMQTILHTKWLTGLKQRKLSSALWWS